MQQIKIFLLSLFFLPVLGPTVSASIESAQKPNWVTNSEYVTFQNSEAYIKENWQKILALRSEAENINQDSANQFFKKILELQKINPKDYGIKFELALIIFKNYEHISFADKSTTDELKNILNVDLSNIGNQQEKYIFDLWKFKINSVFNNSFSIKDIGDLTFKYKNFDRNKFIKDNYFDKFKLTDDYKNVSSEFIFLNEDLIDFSLNSSTHNNKKYLPLRKLSNILNYELIWSEIEKKIIIKNIDFQIEYIIGENQAKINNKTITLESPLIIENSHILIPLKFVSEHFNYDVVLDNSRNTIFISNKIVFKDDDIRKKPKSDLEFNKKISFSSSVSKNDNYDISNDEALKWMDASSSIVYSSNFYKLDSFDEKNKNDLKINSLAVLNNYWDIENKEELEYQIYSLFVSGDNQEYQKNINFLKTLSSSELTEYIDNLPIEKKGCPDYTLSLNQKWGDKEVIAIDLFRIGSIINASYYAEFITKEEASELMKPAAYIIKSKFSNWKEATENFLDGYHYISLQNPNSPNLKFESELAKNILNDTYPNIYDNSLFE